MFSFFEKLVPFVLIIFNGKAYEYCKDGKEVQLCNEDRHIVCYPEQVELGGELVGHYPMTAKMKREILRHHNECRNIFACGEAIGNDGKNYPKAMFMRELVWDPELAYTARVHAARCKIDHDHCRNTFRFEYSGQNLYYWGQEDEGVEVDFLLRHGIVGWYEEYNLTNAAALLSLSPIGLEAIGHFTLMVQDNVTRVGCSMTHCREFDGFLGYFLTCNYDYGNAAYQPVYNYGEPASKCDNLNVEKSATYRCLCSNAAL